MYIALCSYMYIAFTATVCTHEKASFVSLNDLDNISILLEVDHDLDEEITHLFNPFHATNLFWYLLKTSENQRFSDVFRGHQKRSVAWNGLMKYVF